jgi:anti-sigma regulatory factor (Ser/Thr protein kinase)
MAESESDRLELVADPSAVGRARAWLSSRLEDWSPDAVATVQLLVSELVTNAILHSGDVVEVTAQRSGSEVTVEVSDRNPSKPIVKTYGKEAATGRGLHLVEALAEAWGVRGSDTRKAVWFRVVDHPSQQPATASVVVAASMRESDALPGHPEATLASAPRTSQGSGLTVCLDGLPVSVYLAAEEHHDALMREFALLLLSASAPDPGVPPRLMGLAASLVKAFGTTNERRRAQVETARKSGELTVDLMMTFPPRAQHTVIVVADNLDEVDEFCEQGVLLTPPSSPAVKQFRHWYSKEIARQLQGQPPGRWPYPIASG